MMKMKNRNSSPVENFESSTNYIQFLKDLNAANTGMLSCIELCKERLGYQDRTSILSQRRRFFIWEKEHYRLYVHNCKGIVVEVILNKDNSPVVGPKVVWSDVYEDFNI